MRALLIAIPAIVALGVGAATVASQERQGRFVMSPTENGFVRLDTETGAMSVCAQRNGRWICELMEDEAKALRDENARLRAEVKRLQDEAALAEQAPSTRQPERQLELPTEEEVDKALDYFENIFRKFRERIEKFEDKDKGQKDGAQL